MTGGETSANAATSIGTEKAATTPTASGSATSAAGEALAGGATAGAAAGAGAGAAAEERAGTGSTEEAEVRKLHPQTHTTNNNSTGDQTQECRGSEAPVSTVELCISDAEVQLQTSRVCCWEETEQFRMWLLFYFILDFWSVLLGVVIDKEQCGRLCNHISGDSTTQAGTGLITRKVNLHPWVFGMMCEVV